MCADPHDAAATKGSLVARDFVRFYRTALVRRALPRLADNLKVDDAQHSLATARLYKIGFE